MSLRVVRDDISRLVYERRKEHQLKHGGAIYCAVILHSWQGSLFLHQSGSCECSTAQRHTPTENLAPCWPLVDRLGSNPWKKKIRGKFIRIPNQEILMNFKESFITNKNLKRGRVNSCKGTSKSPENRELCGMFSASKNRIRPKWVLRSPEGSPDKSGRIPTKLISADF